MLTQVDIHMQKNKIRPDLQFTLYTKINSKWVTDPNIRAKSTELLEESIAVNLHNIGLDNSLLDTTPKAPKQKKNRHTELHHILKLYLLQITPSRKFKENPQNGKSILKSHNI